MRYKPYPKYKDSGVEWLGDVPEGWEVRRLASIGNFSKGGGFSKKDLVDKGLSAILYGDIYTRYNIQIKSISRYISEETAKNVVKIQKNDLLFTGSGETVEDIGKSVTYLDSEKIYAGGDVIIFRQTIADSLFLSYALSSNSSIIQKSLIAKGQIIVHIYASGLRNILITFPPLKEQTQIATYLTQKTKKIDTLIEKQQSLIKLLKEKRQALVDKALNEDDIKSIRIDKVINKIYRPVYRDKNKTYTTLGLYNRGRGLFHREPKVEDELGESDFYWVEDGDLILSGQFAWEGAIALAKKDENITIVSHRFPIVRGKKNILNTEYLWAFFTTQLGNFILNEHSVGSAGRNRPLNMNTLVKEKIPLPSMEAQMKVAKVVQIEQLLHVKINKEIALLKERRVALVSAVVGGKVDVREWEVN